MSSLEWGKVSTGCQRGLRGRGPESGRSPIRSGFPYFRWQVTNSAWSRRASWVPTGSALTRGDSLGGCLLYRVLPSHPPSLVEAVLGGSVVSKAVTSSLNSGGSGTEGPRVTPLNPTPQREGRKARGYTGQVFGTTFLAGSHPRDRHPLTRRPSSEAV